MSEGTISPAAADRVSTLPASTAPNMRPLCVDLDGTLVATDTMVEAALALLRRRPATLLQMPLWLTRGRARFKNEVAGRQPVQAAGLPYRPEIVDFVRESRAHGRRVLLTTGSHRATADAVAAHLGLFDEVLATDATTNIRGHRKLAAIRAAIGDEPFDYIGDATPDVPVLRAAHTAYLASPARGAVRAMPKAQVLVAAAENVGLELLRAMRPLQWVKNALLAVPMLVGWQLGDAWRWAGLIAAFVVFSLAASSVYLVNDLFDLGADRAHPTKRRRPLASGRLPLSLALIAAPALVLLALAVSVALLPWSFVGTLVLYLACTALYSWVVKERAVLDVLWLAGLYTLRLIAGGEATGVFPSAWLLAFSMFLFLSLALAKRYAELARVDAQGGTGAAGRGYRTTDLPLIESAGLAAGYMTVLVLALYINSGDVRAVYRHPELLWLICPLVLYWITRLWLWAHRRALNEDPLAFAIKDVPSYIIASAAVIIACLAL